MEKNIYISMLLELYGKLLTDKQIDIVDLYYNKNLSLSEIAEELNITRQGVRKSLVDSEAKLLDFEEKLELLKEKTKREETINEIIKNIDDENVINKLLKIIN